MRVMILGGRAPVALDLARRFGERGHVVHVADSGSCRLSGLSSAVHCIEPVPRPRSDVVAFGAALARIVQERGIELVVPTCEEVFYLSRIRHRLPANCQVLVAPFQVLRLLHSKLDFLDLARACTGDVPPSHAVMTLQEAREWAGTRSVAIKPEYSRFGVHVRLYPDGIPPDAPPLASLGRWVVQEFQRGREVCSYALAVDGEVKVNVCYSPSYRLAGSSSYYFESVHEERIDAFVRRLAGSIRYTGQLSFDWVVRDDGTPVVLECNPRAISGLHLVPRALDMPDAMTGGPPLQMSGTALPPRMIAAVMLGVGLPVAIRRGTTSRWWTDWRRATDVLAEPGDSWPLVGAVVDMLAFARTSWREGCSVREASTRDIEWDGEALPE